MSETNTPGVLFILGRERMGQVPVFLGNYAGDPLNSEPVCISMRTYHPWFEEWIKQQTPPPEIVRQHEQGDLASRVPAAPAEADSHRRITTPCPSCGSSSLFIGTGGHLTCGVLGCKDPSPQHAIEVLRAGIVSADERTKAAERRTRSFASDFSSLSDRMKDVQAERDALVGCVRMLTERVEGLERKIARAAEANDQGIPF